MWRQSAWAAVFDLLACEYGWTDEQILDLSLPRIQQACGVILARRDRDYTQTGRLHEAAAKHIVAQVAASTPGAKKSAGQQAAKNVEFFGKPKRREVSEEQLVAAFGPPLVVEESGVSGNG